LTCGLDTNILVYTLDELCPENERCASILDRLPTEFLIALTPTTLHEAYTVLVYARKWERDEALRHRVALMKNPYVRFYNQTREVTTPGLHLANRYSIRGRDALVLSNLLINRVNTTYTYDEEIKKLGKVTWLERSLMIEDPTAEQRAQQGQIHPSPIIQSTPS